MSAPADLEADRLLAAGIIREDDAYRRVRLIHAYYSDLDRANRTERGVIYLHLGMLAGSAALLDLERQQLRRRLRSRGALPFTPITPNGHGDQ